MSRTTAEGAEDAWEVLELRDAWPAECCCYRGPCGRGCSTTTTLLLAISVWCCSANATTAPSDSPTNHTTNHTPTNSVSNSSPSPPTFSPTIWAPPPVPFEGDGFFWPLKIFYYSTLGDYWYYENWFERDWLGHYESYYDWFGLSCSAGMVVDAIHFDNNGLVGTISPSLGNMSTLGTLVLRNDELISGTIPRDLFTGALHTFVSFGTALSGTLPDAYTGAPMNSLLVGGCRVSGTLPAALFESGVKSIDLSTTRISGDLGALTSHYRRAASELLGLILLDARLSGTIPVLVYPPCS